MRKLFFGIAAAGALFTGTPGNADDLSHTVNLTANVPLTCAFTGPINSSGLSDVMEGDSQFAVDVSPGKARDQNASLSYANVYCNGNSATVKLEGKGLKNSATTTNQTLKTKVEYVADVSWGGTNGIVQLDTRTTPDGVVTQVVPARSGNFILTIHIPESDGPFLAGQYTDALILTVTPTT